MTIQGAVYELEQMLSRTDIPDYIKPTIKKVVETIVDELKELKTKETPTQPKTITRYGMGNEYHDYICPNCETFLCYEPEGRSRQGNTRCQQCGQIIEWNL